MCRSFRAWLCLAAWTVISAVSGGTDWPEPRQNNRLTAMQRVGGNMKQAPEVIAAYDLGRNRPSLTKIPAPDSPQEWFGVCVVNGALYCFDQDGNQLWKNHPPGINFSDIITAEDLDGDGSIEILLTAGRPAQPFAAACLVSAKTGDLIWRYDVDPISYSWRLLADHYLPGSGQKQIIVLMQGYPPDEKFGYIAMFNFPEQGQAPEKIWRYDFHQYTCRPALLQTDVDGDGVEELAVQTHSRMWLLDPQSGKVEDFLGWDVSPANIRSYGHVEFADLNNDGFEDFLCIATFAQHHEVLLNHHGKLKQAWSHGWDESVTTGKLVSTWPTPPYADVDGDGRFEVVVSMFNSESDQSWMVRVYDASTGEVERRIPGYVATHLQDFNGDGAAEIVCKRSNDPNEEKIEGAVVFSWENDDFVSLWEDVQAILPFSNKRSQSVPDEVRFVREGQSFTLKGDQGGKLVADLFQAPPQTEPIFEHVPGIVGAPFPNLLAADLTGNGKNDLLVYRNPIVEILEIDPQGGFRNALCYESDCLPALADFDGDGNLDIALGDIDPIRTPTIEVKTPSQGDRLVWRSVFPEPQRPGLPQPRRLYMRTGRFTGGRGSDLYVWAGTPLVRSAVLNGRTGEIVWEKGEVPDSERYWGPSMDLASVYDFNGDKADDLVFTNPDYYCIANGLSGEFLLGPKFPAGEIFDQPSQGLYTLPAVLSAPDSTATVCLVSGHYFQGAMTIGAQPYWHKLPPVGENPCANEGFLQTQSGEWLMGFGRQNGRFACVNVSDGALRWELDVSASCSDAISCDVDGDGASEFVFGTSHGELYALADKDEGRPQVIWKKEFPGWVGSPIAADVTGDGAVEIIVPVSDGNVYILGFPD